MPHNRRNERWRVRVDLSGTLTDAQAARIIEEDGVHSIAHGDGTVCVRGAVFTSPPTRGANGTWAPVIMERARHYLTNLTTLRTLTHAGLLTVDRVTVERDTPHTGLPLLGAAEIAALLGVSTTRVRQLRAHDGWPTPAVSTAGGDLYWAADIAAFQRSWERREGRPPATAGG